MLRAAALRAVCRPRSYTTQPIKGEGATAVVLGGFGFTQRQLTKHEALYQEHGFEVLPVLSSITQLISVEQAGRRGAELAQRIQEEDSDIVIHTVSGSFWTAMFALAAMEPAWRERRVKAIMFDSCPPESNVYAFGGWLSWFLQAKTGLPWAYSKPLVSHLFHPVRPAFGINEECEPRMAPRRRRLCHAPRPSPPAR